MLRILWLFFSLCYIQHNCIPTSHALSFLYVFLFLFLSLSYLSSFYPPTQAPAICSRQVARENCGEGGGEAVFVFFVFHFISFHLFVVVVVVLYSFLFPSPPILFFFSCGRDFVFVFLFVSVCFANPSALFSFPFFSVYLFVRMCVCKGEMWRGKWELLFKKMWRVYISP